MVGAVTTIPMVAITKDLFSKLYHMVPAGSLWKMAIFTKGRSGLEGLMAMATLGPIVVSIEDPLRIMLGMAMVRKRPMIWFFRAFFNMAIGSRAS